MLAEEKFLKIKQCWNLRANLTEYLQELLQSLLKDLQILNEIQPFKQEISNQIQKDQEEKNIAELLAEERFQKANQALNESQSPQEIRIQDSEIQKQQCLEEMEEWMNDLGENVVLNEEEDSRHIHYPIFRPVVTYPESDFYSSDVVDPALMVYLAYTIVFPVVSSLGEVSHLCGLLRLHPHDDPPGCYLFGEGN
ncbi:hypothetical protein Tco_0443445 [Tanacetum coccineum]